MAFIITATNFFIDPYGIQDFKRIGGFNSKKPEMGPFENLFKAQLSQKKEWEVVFLGTSATRMGIDPESVVLNGRLAVNLGSGGQPYSASYRLLSHVRTASNASIFFGVDFLPSNSYFPVPRSWLEIPFSRSYRYTSLLSNQQFNASLKTLIYNVRNPVAFKCIRTENDFVLSNGFHCGRQHIRPQRLSAIQTEEGLVRLDYFPEPNRTFLLDVVNGPMRHLSDATKFTKNQKLHLTFFISPMHVRHLELIYAVGLWDLFEEWKRALVKIADSAGVVLFDFSGYTFENGEPFPEINAPDFLMKGYYDSLHYQPSLGDNVLSVMLGDQTSLLSNNRIILSKDNIDLQIHKVRLDQEIWRKKNPEVAAEIAKNARESLASIGNRQIIFFGAPENVGVNK